MKIGIYGQLNGGKDTFADFATEIGIQFERLKFADALKDCVCIILGCTREELEDREFKEGELDKEWWKYYHDGKYYDYNTIEELRPLVPWFKYQEVLIKMTPRKILQLLGTEGGRDLIHPEIWVNSLISKIKKLGDANVFVTDMRFPNELTAIKKQKKGFTVKILRPFSGRFPEYAHLVGEGDPYAVPEALTTVDPELYEKLTHPSETSLLEGSGFDFVILNDGDLDLFRARCVEVLMEIQNRCIVATSK